MFIERLTGPQRRALAHLMVTVAVVDGRLHVREREFIAGYLRRCGIEEDLIDSPQPVEVACAAFDSYAARVVALQELLRLACIDLEFDESEREQIAFLAALMEVPAEVLEMVEQWVLDGYDWLLRGEAMLDP